MRAVQSPGLVRVLKSDVLGRVELLDGPRGLVVRRVASGGPAPGSGALARALARRERAALVELEGLAEVPRLLSGADYAGAPSADGTVPRAETVLLRTWIEGQPLYAASELPRDYFERLEELVRALHERGVCHNDLHKEANVLVGADGRPGLIDFQLASVHRRRGALFASRAREDLRHVAKHRAVYERALGPGTPGKSPADVPRMPGRGAIAAAWMTLAKPLYNRVVHGWLALERREGRRSGEWPRWVAPVGPREPAGVAGPTSRAGH